MNHVHDNKELFTIDDSNSQSEIVSQNESVLYVSHVKTPIWIYLLIPRVLAL